MLKHRKPIKKLAFALSLAALLVWCAFGTGTSLAWFQDESNVVKNVINMAEFDLELSYKVGDTYTSVEGASTIFDPNALYEPGYTEVACLQITNNGTVPFNFKTAVAVSNFRTAHNVFGSEFYLQDHLRYGVVFADTEAQLEAILATREDAIAIADTPLDNYESTVRQLDDGQSVYMAIVVHMPTDVSNVANYEDHSPLVELMLVATAEQLK